MSKQPQTVQNMQSEFSDVLKQIQESRQNNGAEKLAPCAKLRLGTPRMRGFSFIEIKLNMA